MLIYCHQFTICSAKLINKFQTDMFFAVFSSFMPKSAILFVILWPIFDNPLYKRTTMTIDNIKTLIVGYESRTLELKKTTGELKDGMHTACAFLNTDGGWLIFGITPKSLKIIGQEVKVMPQVI